MIDVARPVPPLEREAVPRPVMVQRWTDVVFLHWRYPPDAVQRLLPAGVQVDVHDESPWVGLVPFRMEGLGLPGLAPLPLVGEFPEVNVRTYVRSGSRRGVWFFSLDIDRLLPVVVARVAYRLPYYFGRVEHHRVGDIVTSAVHRRWPRVQEAGRSEIALRTGEETDPTARLEHFLTSRWGLIAADRRGSLRYAAVDHQPWPLHRAEVLHLDDHLVTLAGLPSPTGEPHALWAPGVDVRVGRPIRVDPPG